MSCASSCLFTYFVFFGGHYNCPVVSVQSRLQNVKSHYQYQYQYAYWKVPTPVLLELWTTVLICWSIRIFEVLTPYLRNGLCFLSSLRCIKIWIVICYRGLKFPQRTVVLLPLKRERERELTFFCVLRKLSVLSICCLWHCRHKCCLSRCSTEMLVATAYRGHLSGLDSLSTRWSWTQCDLKFRKLIDNMLAICWIRKAGTFSDLWGHMTLQTRKISVDIYHAVVVHYLASKMKWRMCKILFPEPFCLWISVC